MKREFLITVVAEGGSDDAVVGDCVRQLQLVADALRGGADKAFTADPLPCRTPPLQCDYYEMPEVAQ